MTATLPSRDYYPLKNGQPILEPSTLHDVETVNSSVRVDGAEVTYTVHYPRGSQIGEHATRLVIPGYFACEAMYKHYARELASRGETVATYTPARHQGSQSLRPGNLIHPERLLPKAAVTIAHELNSDYKISEYHISGNSMGGPAAIAAAKYSAANPKEPRVASVELLASAGVTHHNLLTLGAASLRLMEEAREAHVLSRQRREHLTTNIARYGLTNVVRTVTEGFQVSNCRIRPSDIAALQQREVVVTGLFHDNDPYFPAATAYKNIGHIVNYFVYGQPPKGGHLAPYTYPAEVARDSHDVLELLKDTSAVIKPSRVVIA